MSVISGFLVGCVFFVVAVMIFTLFTMMWIQAKPSLDNSTTAAGAKAINNLGNAVFLTGADSIIILFYFVLIIGVFVSAYYEAADVITFPLGIALLIPLIIVTFPLTDFLHAYLVALPAVAPYYQGTEYLVTIIPITTAIVTIAYLVFVTTRRNQGAPSGPTIYSG